MGNYLRGSEWRRWDLHLHTASSYDYKYKRADSDEQLCKMLTQNEVAAVAITDHFVIDAQRIEHLRSLNKEITFFPGVELRTDKGGKNLHVILIFPEYTDLKILSGAFDFEILRNAEGLDKQIDNMDNDEIRNKYHDQLHWNFRDIIKFAKKHNGIVSIHAGRKTNGIDKEITNALPYRDAEKEEIAKNVDIFEGSSVRDVEVYKTKIFPNIKENKPIIVCSDNHNPNQYCPNEKLWIKANCTFDGLKQAIIQPDDRIFVGDIPPALKRLRDNRISTIKNVEVHKIQNPKRSESKWFNFSMPLNPGLIAIIGNKGSGKSALSDILGLLCNCQNINYASFLTSKRFKKGRNNYAQDYIAKAIWYDLNVRKVNLNDTIQKDEPNFAQYLPQNYIEDICNTLDNKFQDEIDKVIFSYIDKNEKGTACDLSELIQKKTKQNDFKLSNLRSRLTEINKEIISLEDKKTTEYQNSINKKIKANNEFLNRLIKDKPKRVARKFDEKKETEYSKRINDISKSISNTRKEITGINIRLQNIEPILDECNYVVSAICEVERLVLDTQNKVDELIKQNSEIPDLPKIELRTPKGNILRYINRLQKEKEKLNNSLNDSQNGLNEKLKQLEIKKDNIVKTASEPERKYQNFLKNYSNWKKQCLAIIGDAKQIDTLRYLHSQEKYLKENLNNDYEKSLDKRNYILKEIFMVQQELLDTYQRVFNPIQENFDSMLKGLNEEITFKAEIQLENQDEFMKGVLNFINLRRSGIFHGLDNANERMTHIISETNFNDFESLKTMIGEITKVISEDFDSAKTKVQQRNLFYDYLFSLSYLSVNFKLKVGDKGLDELSPGERGIALLIFYLTLSKDNSPIIIDQPEDNLDNQSVYAQLVPLIKKARNHRQVIIVTHNPNIAVACDADQIIYSAMDKVNQSISYVSGAIEDKNILKHVTDVLEGTMPAFELRRKKYHM